jgi:hypothetical protein
MPRGHRFNGNEESGAVTQASCRGDLLLTKASSIRLAAMFSDVAREAKVIGAAEREIRTLPK